MLLLAHSAMQQLAVRDSAVQSSYNNNGLQYYGLQ